MSKSAISRRRYFANRAARRDAQNEINKQNNKKPVSLRTMVKIQPPAPKPKVVVIKEVKKVAIAAEVVEARESLNAPAPEKNTKKTKKNPFVVRKEKADKASVKKTEQVHKRLKKEIKQANKKSPAKTAKVTAKKVSKPTNTKSAPKKSPAKPATKAKATKKPATKANNKKNK